ncbi:TRAP transporter small permease [Sporomusa malonica]|uniref:Tripartite ATP-independent transporter, DctQ component n=1 Tax=Sporomusa malonica TaxID=112901 RepID=A0A1W2EEU4_9FIRM|nr:TRAP transporter small permease [Sporomusa malonica]SMD08167.1 Tripartite ATP-independent transporter, DctQ component [Sporomusa malonica]
MKQLFDNLEDYLCISLLVVMSLVVFLQILSRFVFNIPLRWTEEFAVFLLAWVSFLGASVGVKRWAHIGVEAFVLLLPKKMQHVVKLLSLVLSAIFFAIMLYYGIEIVLKQVATGQVSAAMRIPMYLAYLSVPVGATFMLIRTIQLFLTMARKGVQA